MRPIGSRACLVAGVLALAALPGRALAQEPPPDPKEAMSRLMREAVDFFEMGRYDDCRKRLDQVLALDPNYEEASRFKSEIGDRMMIQLMTEPRVGRAPMVIYELARRYEVRRSRKASYVKPLVEIATSPGKHPVDRWDAIHRLEGVGQFAVPFLVENLGSHHEAEVRALARFVATKMGPAAVLPVIELLKMRGEGDPAEDKRLLSIREAAALILGDIGDPRAVAALRRLTEMTDQQESGVVKRCAYRSILQITGKEPESLPGSQQYYLNKADRYLKETSDVPPEAARADGVVWRLVGGKLVDFEVPVYAWNEVMAEQACFDCMDVDPSFEAIYPVLAQAVASQIAEVKELLVVAKERPLGRPLTAEQTSDLEARGKALDQSALLLRSMGPANVYGALERALSDAGQEGSPDQRSLAKLAAAELCDALVALDPAGAMLPKPGEASDPRRPKKREAAKGDSLIRALRYHDERVKYAAARAVARMNPPQPFEGAREVIGVLAQAVGESGPLQILVVEEDSSIMNELAGKLRELDMVVATASAAQEGLTRAGGFPPLDVIIASPKLTSQTSVFLDELLRSERGRVVPVAVLTNYAAREGDVQAFGGMKNVKGFIPIEDTGRELRRLVEKVASFRVFPIMSKTQSEEVSAGAAQALAGVDPVHARNSGMDTQLSGEACIAALTNRSDAVRLPCIRALGKFGIAQAHEPLVAIAADAGEALEIRKAAAASLGQITPDRALEALLSVAKDGELDYVLRAIGSTSYGKAEASPAKRGDSARALRMPLEDRRALEYDAE